MKKYLLVTILLCLSCTFFTGCKNSFKEQATQEVQETKNSSKSAGGVDVDLTVMGSTLVYAEVYNMMNNPNDYMGKTVKMRGPYYTEFSAETGKNYYFVIIEDATACCKQGLEFIWNGKHTFPDDYPESETEICVTGVFRSYDELGETYYYLAVDDIIALN